MTTMSIVWEKVKQDLNSDFVSCTSRRLPALFPRTAITTALLKIGSRGIVDGSRSALGDARHALRGHYPYAFPSSA